jgi:hypothetical protein
MKNALVSAAVASCLAAAAHAATPAPVPEQLLACSKLSDESARVRCYDEQIAALNAAAAAAPKAATSAPVAPAASTVTPAAPASTAPASAGTTAPAKTAPAAAANSGPAGPQAGSAEQEFGKESLPRTAREKRPENEATLVSTITDIHSLGQSIYMISLANGQVWRQEGSSLTSFFRNGYDVQIEKATLGSYRMSTPQTGTKNWVRVTRVR